MHSTTYRTQANSLMDLLGKIAETVGLLGADAEWAGDNDGALRIWKGDCGPVFTIEPTAKPTVKTSGTEGGA
jgi:hypothetical protein